MDLKTLSPVVTSFLCLYLLIVLTKLIQRLWWHPMHLQKLMKSQGIEGPRYKILHGSTKEATHMISEAMSKTMELSHDILPKVLPHIHAWMKLYGNDQDVIVD